MAITVTNPSSIRTTPGVKVTLLRDTRVPLHGPQDETANIVSAGAGAVHTVHSDTAQNLFHAGAARPYAEGDEKAPAKEAVTTNLGGGAVGTPANPKAARRAAKAAAQGTAKKAR